MDDIGLLAVHINALGLHDALRLEFGWARRSQDSELREGILEPADVGGLEVALVRLGALAIHEVLVETESLTSGVVSLAGSSAPQIGTKSGPGDSDSVGVEAHLRSLKTNLLRVGDLEDVVARVGAPSIDVLGLDTANGISTGLKTVRVHEFLFVEGASESATKDTNSASIDCLVVSKHVLALENVLTDNAIF